MTAQPSEAACAAVMGPGRSEPARDDISLLMIRRPVTGEEDADAGFAVEIVVGIPVVTGPVEARRRMRSDEPPAHPMAT